MTAFLSKYVVTIIRADSLGDDENLEIYDKNDEIVNLRHEDAFTPARFLICYANTRNTPLLEEILKCIENTDGETPKSYLDNLLNQLKNFFHDESFARLLLVDKAVAIDKKKKKLSVEELKKSLRDEVPSFFLMAESMASLACTAMAPSDDYTDGNGKWIIAMRLDHTFYGTNIYYNVVSAVKDGKTIFLDSFSFISAHDALGFELADIARRDICLKRCVNCKKFFIPKARSDEKYCDNIAKNGRTCKQIAFDMMIENDEALRVYRSMYKTQNARLQRHAKGKTVTYKATLASRFAGWRDNAKQLLQMCREGSIDAEEMRKQIEGDSWLKEGAVNAQK